MELVYVKSGRFMMGSKSGAAEEKPAHEVTISRAFYMAKHEVTQQQYERVAGEHPSKVEGAALPVEAVSWKDAQGFCEELSRRTGRKIRLPTEAEWEYACRAGSTSSYCFGDGKTTLGKYAWYGGTSSGKTHPVARKRANAWGLHDMHGNVQEWCADWYDPQYYGDSPQENPTGPTSGRRHVVRGGSWKDGNPRCRSASRGSLHPSIRLESFGFRVVTGVPGSEPRTDPVAPAGEEGGKSGG